MEYYPPYYPAQFSEPRGDAKGIGGIVAAMNYTGSIGESVETEDHADLRIPM